MADYYGVIRYAMRGNSKTDFGIPITSGIGVPSILIEHCFMTGTKDVKFYNSDLSLQNLAKAEADAIVEYYKLEKKDPTKVKSILLEKSEEDIAIGDKIKINATVLPDTAINKNLIYKTSDEKIATVDDKGNITGISKGNVTITVTSEDGKKEAEYKANIVEAAIMISNPKINIVNGKSAKIRYSITPKSLTNKNISYISENPEIATVNEQGVVNGIIIGTTKIRAKLEFNDKTEEIIVNVRDAEKYNIDINLEKRNLTDDEVISKISEKTTVKQVLDDFDIGESLEFLVLDYKKEALLLEDNITTESKIIIRDIATQEIISEFYTIITGDINRDGAISPADYVLIKKQIMENSEITGLQMTAADVKKDGKISPADYVMIKNHIMETKEIVPE